MRGKYFMEKIKQQLHIIKKSIPKVINQLHKLQQQYPQLIAVKNIALSLVVLILVIKLSYGVGKSTEATTISQYIKEVDSQSEIILQLKLDIADLKQKQDTAEVQYSELDVEYTEYKKEMALFEGLSEEDKKELSEKVKKRDTEEIAKKEENKKVEEAKKKEEERIAAEEESAKKKEEEEIAASKVEYDYEKEYDAATQEVADTLNDSFSNLGYFTFDDTSYTFTLHVTDQGLKDNISAIMNGNLPKEQWTHYITDGMVELSTTISNTYGYGWFSLAVANPFGSDYQLLKVVDGVVMYDFVEELD